jgi:hypothetical protein
MLLYIHGSLKSSAVVKILNILSSMPGTTSSQMSGTQNTDISMDKTNQTEFLVIAFQ